MMLFRSLFFSLPFWGVAITTGVAAFIFLRSLSSVPLAFATFADPAIPLSAGSAFLLRTVQVTLLEYSTTTEMLVTIVAALLIGFNCALLVFQPRISRVNAPRYALGVGALFSAIGIGCAACGPLVAYAIAAQFGAIGILASLPYGGAEIGYLGVVILLIATFLIVYALHRRTCPVR